MARVLLTGMSGTGKSTVRWTLTDGRWDEPRMSELLADHDPVAVSGTVENQGVSYDRFQHVVLLSAPLDVLWDRVARRTDNPYGTTEEQQREIQGYVATVEPLLRAGATLELDGRRPVAELADLVDGLLRG